MKHYIWFILSGIWIVASITNYYTGESNTVTLFNLLSAALLAALGVIQSRYERNGDAGKRIWKRVYIISLIAVLLFEIAVLVFLIVT